LPPLLLSPGRPAFADLVPGATTLTLPDSDTFQQKVVPDVP
jgi:hypothetical protein